MDKKNVVNFPKKKITITRLYCTECGSGLDYWLGTDGCGYGSCHRCDLLQPEEFNISSEETEH